jgi:hypothetical protein
MGSWTRIAAARQAGRCRTVSIRTVVLGRRPRSSGPEEGPAKAGLGRASEKNRTRGRGRSAAARLGVRMVASGSAGLYIYIHTLPTMSLLYDA